MKTKKCNSCKQHKKLDMFYIIRGKPESVCKICKKKANQKRRHLYPYLGTLNAIQNRCKSSKSYIGIKALITTPELKELWFRDKAYEMKIPSIDRIDPDGDYTKENCRYIELSKNSKGGRRWRWVNDRKILCTINWEAVIKISSEYGERTKFINALRERQDDWIKAVKD